MSGGERVPSIGDAFGEDAGAGAARTLQAQAQPNANEIRITASGFEAASLTVNAGDGIDWSYALLDMPERTLLNRLSVFAGGCSLEAIEAVDSGALPLLQRLIAKSLVIAEPMRQ
jgi:hypothetical protein